MPTVGGRRIFLDAEHRADARLGGQAILDRFYAEEESGGGEHLAGSAPAAAAPAVPRRS